MGCRGTALASPWRPHGPGLEAASSSSQDTTSHENGDGLLKIFPMQLKITKLNAIAPRPGWLFCCDLAEVRPLTAFQCGPG